MVARRDSKGSSHRPTEQQPPPAPGAEWGDEEEFERFWGKSLEEMHAEFRREDATAPHRRVLTEAEFLASLEGRP